MEPTELTHDTIELDDVGTGANGAADVVAEPPALEDPTLYFNRELSWMDFNDRVLQLAEDESVPLLERMKFCAIWNSNLDEFFMVRVAGLHDQIDAGIEKAGQDGLTPLQQVQRLREVFRVQAGRARRCTGRSSPASSSGACASRGSTSSPTRSARSSGSASTARSSPCSHRSRSAWAAHSPTSPTCRCRSPCRCATRRRTSRPS